MSAHEGGATVFCCCECMQFYCINCEDGAQDHCEDCGNGPLCCACGVEHTEGHRAEREMAEEDRGEKI